MYNKNIITLFLFAFFSISSFGQNKVFIKRIQDCPDSILYQLGLTKEPYLTVPLDTAYININEQVLKISGHILIPTEKEDEKHVRILLDIGDNEIKTPPELGEWHIVVKEGRGQGKMKKVLVGPPSLTSRGKILVLYARAHMDLRNELNSYICYKIRAKNKTEKNLAINNICVTSSSDSSKTAIFLGGTIRGADISYKNHIFHVARYMEQERTDSLVRVHWWVDDDSKDENDDKPLVSSDENGNKWQLPVKNGKGRGKMSQKISSPMPLTLNKKELFVYAKARYNQQDVKKCFLHLKIRVKKRFTDN